jgi:transcriptional regulator with XRE-family HTH domain
MKALPKDAHPRRSKTPNMHNRNNAAEPGMTNIGEKLRAIRTEKGLSLREVAARAEVSASLLSQIETGKVNPSVMSLFNIAAAVGVPVTDLMPSDVRPIRQTPVITNNHNGVTASEMRMTQLHQNNSAAFNDVQTSECITVLYPEARPMISLMGGVTWARLTCNHEDDIEFLEITYAPQSSSGPALSRHNGREWGLVLEGELSLELGFDRHLLRPGDSIVFDSTTPHRLTNNGDTPMKAIWVMFNRKP